MVTAIDDSLGRVQNTLDRLGLTGNTIVVFYSDNGGMAAANLGNPKRVVSPDLLDAAYSTSNLPLRGAKGWLYEGGIRVPLIVRWPGAGQTGAVRDEPVISPDFYPTLLDMAGLPRRPDQHVDGVSFAAAVRGEDFERGAIYWHFPHYSNHGMPEPRRRRPRRAATSCWSTSRTARCNSSTWRTTRANSATWPPSSQRKPPSSAPGFTPWREIRVGGDAESSSLRAQGRRSGSWRATGRPGTGTGAGSAASRPGRRVRSRPGSTPSSTCSIDIRCSSLMCRAERPSSRNSARATTPSGASASRMD